MRMAVCAEMVFVDLPVALDPMTPARIVWPTLIAMCGLPFAGKSVLARSLSHELGLRLLSYDFEIYLPHRHLVPPGSSVAAEYDFAAGRFAAGAARPRRAGDLRPAG